MARIAVLEFEQQASDTPIHFIPKKLVEPFKSHRHQGRKAVVVIHDYLLQIVEDVTFGQIKEFYKRPAAVKIVIPRLLPPRGPEGLLITYPIPDQRTVYL